MGNKIEFSTIKGKTINRLKILSEADSILTSGGNKKRACICVCKCGKIKTFRLESVIKGATKSCGCLNKELISNRAYERNIKHGKHKTSEYNSWISLRKRCNNPNSSAYKYYGGRGIKVCDRWQNSFLNFINDMGERPSKNHSIDRIDVNGNYEPSNCRWATRTEQSRNVRTNVIVEFDGTSKCLSEWAIESNLSWQCLFYRIFIAKKEKSEWFKPKNNDRNKHQTDVCK